MKVSVLSSGSKGNTTFVETSNAKILLDCGNTYKYISEKLKELFKAHDRLIDDILRLIRQQTEMMDSNAKTNNTIFNFVERQGNLIIILLDEVNRLNKRIDKLEKVIEDVQS